MVEEQVALIRRDETETLVTDNFLDLSLWQLLNSQELNQTCSSRIAACSGLAR